MKRGGGVWFGFQGDTFDFCYVWPVLAQNSPYMLCLCVHTHTISHSIRGDRGFEAWDPACCLPVGRLVELPLTLLGATAGRVCRLRVLLLSYPCVRLLFVWLVAGTLHTPPMLLLSWVSCGYDCLGGGDLAVMEDGHLKTFQQMRK